MTIWRGAAAFAAMVALLTGCQAAKKSLPDTDTADPPPAGSAAADGGDEEGKKEGDRGGEEAKPGAGGKGGEETKSDGMGGMPSSTRGPPKSGGKPQGACPPGDPLCMPDLTGQPKPGTGAPGAERKGVMVPE